MCVSHFCPLFSPLCLFSGVLHSDFHTGADFELVREYAEKMGVLLWHDPMKRMVFVSQAGVAPVRDFIDRRNLRS
jgi:transcription initiation factor TFIIH subunit 4